MSVPQGPVPSQNAAWGADSRGEKVAPAGESEPWGFCSSLNPGCLTPSWMLSSHNFSVYIASPPKASQTEVLFLAKAQNLKNLN
jgi:hypothetical protein